ncbi:dicarboxylate/amino acid:cation symporter [Streptomyces sp. NBC_01591]|uniref:dicarboxylate/amino acid:cation symporter n=1 Tax=Streptomyces sp. NBC_01591 TaxID=2975888 RepID=UPI002DD87967|nr:dicarboxylate/amino acid:cation symporter [Streptomyces sp. NBC_01591]WSD66168.1 dicarboxylate/amino acid:cation symporter [Streptomyces sp. NBC_01591]
MALSLVAGVVAGLGLHQLPAGPRADVVATLETVTHLFLNLIKMVVAPLIFATIVSGITGMARSKGLGSLFARSLVWFVSASLLVGAFGFATAHLIGVGDGLALRDTGGGAGLDAEPVTASSFIEDLVPQSFIQALATNKPVQILLFSMLFGLALLAVRSTSGGSRLAEAVDELAAIMLKMTGYVMLLAPVGVFAAVAGAFTAQGLDALTTYGSLIGGFYAALAGLWVLLLLVGALFLGRSILALVRAVREPMFIAFSTASTEAAFPKLISSLTTFGVDRRTTGLVLPLGYAFNIDGSMMYMTFASAFLVNAYDVDISLSQQILMCLVLLLSSKGMAGVPRGALVIVAAVVPGFGVPAVGVALLLAIDQILDMGRTATNILGNAIAVAVLGRKPTTNASPPSRHQSPAPTDTVTAG